MNEQKSRKSKMIHIVLFALTLGLLAYFCISDHNLMILLNSLHGLNFFWLSLGAGCVVLSWLMDSLVTRCLICAAYDADYAFHHAFKVTMVGQYFNSITPFAVAGQPMQFLTLTRQGVSTGIALSALVRKYLVYQTAIAGYSLFVILIRYSFFRSRMKGFMALAVVGFFYQSAVVVLLFLFAHSPRFTTKLIEGGVKLLTKLHIVKNPEETGEKVKNQLAFYLKNNKLMQGDRLMKARIYGYTVTELTAVFAVPFFIYKAFHNPGAPFVDMIAAQSFVTMISAYTPLPGAAGAAEGSFLMLFQIFFQPNVIRQAMLLWRFITYYSCIIVGSYFALLEHKAQKRHPGFRLSAMKPEG
ncbi:MAG: Phosphatidylglycerol lysyltransferase [Eubacteriales bacterium]|jgi:glycosyltransferase 2 family protein